MTKHSSAEKYISGGIRNYKMDNAGQVKIVVVRKSIFMEILGTIGWTMLLKEK